MVEDEDLNFLKRRRLLELRKRALLQGSATASEKVEKKEKPKSPAEILQEVLIDRAWEVWEAAKLQYPKVTSEVAKAIASAWTRGRLQEKINGEQLYWLFQNMGFPVRLRTHIRFIDGGKAKSIAEKLKEQ
jgi:DNA-binding TFAR19-related protein (PDSD5 family)